MVECSFYLACCAFGEFFRTLLLYFCFFNYIFFLQNLRLKYLCVASVSDGVVFSGFRSKDVQRIRIGVSAIDKFEFF